MWHLLQFSVDGALASDEYDAIALDEGIGLDEVVQAFVGDVTPTSEDNFLSFVASPNLLDLLLVTQQGVETFGDDAVLRDTYLVDVALEGLGVGNVVG